MKNQFEAGRPDQFEDHARRRRERDVLLAVDRASPVPLRAQIEDGVRDAVREGRIAAATVLPSTRALAAELGVSRGVVVDAYAQLAADGFLEIRPGGTTRVAGVPPHAPVAVTHGRGGAGGAGAGGSAPAASRGPGPRDARAPAPPGPRGAPLDLLPMSGDLTAFPRRAWARATRRALEEVPATGLSYGDPAGPEPARRALAAYLGRSRGVLASVETTAVTAGVTDGLVAIARVLVARGARRIAVEDPGFGPHRRVLEHAGLTPVPVPVDEGGLRVDRLAGAAVDAVLVTPAHQSPTGYPLSPARRAALVRWASSCGAVIVEDDYDGEFRYDGQAVGALQALAPDHVAYAGSVSKTLAPGLRVGWLVLPAALRDAVVGERATASGGAAVVEPLALAAMIHSGDYDRHLRACRRTYASRRGAVLAGLAAELPGGQVVGIAAGLHVALVLPAAVEPGALMAAAYRRGLLVLAERVDLRGRAGTLVPVGYGRIAEPAIARALGRLAEAVGEASSDATTPAVGAALA